MTLRRPRRIGPVAALAALLALAAPPPAAAQTGADRAAEAEEEAMRASEEAVAAKIRARRLAEEQDSLSRRLAELGPSIVARETALERAQDRLRVLSREVEAATEELRQTTEELQKLLRAVQRAAREPTPSILAHPDRAVSAARSAMLIRRLSGALSLASARAKSDLDAVATAAAEVRAVEQVARTELAALRSEEAEVRSLLARKRRDARLAAGAVAAAERQARVLRDRADTLADLAEQIDQAPSVAEAAPIAPQPIAPAPQAPAGGSPSAAPAGAPSAAPAGAPSMTAPAAPDAGPRIAEPNSDRAEQPDVFRLPEGQRPKAPRAPAPPAIRFVDAKGKVLRPAAGRLAKAANGAGGVDLLTRPYARVIAPWSGLVRYAGPFPNYGEIVIIEPQKGWQILLTGLGVVERDVGERVLAGEPIGRMGGPPRTSPEFLFEVSPQTRAARQRLYFEIRRSGRPVASAPWLQKVRREGSSL